MINLLNLGTVTSEYGEREAPTAGASTDHKGIDIVLKNSSVPAVTSGKVEASGYNSLSGNYIKIRDDAGNLHSYFHLNERSSLKVGDSVREGQTIGTQGSTGVSTGTHLHYELTSSSGDYINPAEYLAGGASILQTNNEGDGKIMASVKKVLSPVLTAIILLLLFVGAAYFLMKAFGLSIPTKGDLLKKGAELIG